jgi:hypothetical protein
VLIDQLVHHEPMFGLILIALIVVLVPLAAYVGGADSRIDEVARRRRYNG